MLVLGHWGNLFVQNPSIYQELNIPTKNENRHTEGNPKR